MTTIKTIAFTIYTDEQGARVRCCFCGDTILAVQGTVNVTHLAALSEAWLNHPCFQPGADNTYRALRHQLKG
jgi:hypothetical protein